MRVTHLLANAVRSVDDCPHALLARDAHHLLPRQEHTWDRDNRVNHRDDLVPSSPHGRVVPRGQRRHVREPRAGVLLLDLTQLRTEALDDLSMGEWEGIHDVREGRAWLRGAVREVVNRARDGAVCRRSCGGIQRGQRALG